MPTEDLDSSPVKTSCPPRSCEALSSRPHVDSPQAHTPACSSSSSDTLWTCPRASACDLLQAGIFRVCCPPSTFLSTLAQPLKSSSSLQSQSFRSTHRVPDAASPRDLARQSPWLPQAGTLQGLHQREAESSPQRTCLGG